MKWGFPDRESQLGTVNRANVGYDRNYSRAASRGPYSAPVLPCVFFSVRLHGRALQ